MSYVFAIFQEYSLEYSITKISNILDGTPIFLNIPGIFHILKICFFIVTLFFVNTIAKQKKTLLQKKRDIKYSKDTKKSGINAEK